MELALTIAEFAFIGALLLLPAVNMAFAQRDVSAGISARTIRRGWAFAFVIPTLSIIGYWFLFRSGFSTSDSGEVSFEMPEIIIGFIAFFEAIMVVKWAAHSLGPTLLMFYAYQRVVRGPAWCVSQQQEEEYELHKGPWSGRVFFLYMIASQSVVVTLIVFFVTWVIYERRLMPLE